MNLKTKTVEPITEYVVTAFNTNNNQAIEQKYYTFEEANAASKEYKLLGLISFIDIEKDAILF